MKYLIVSRHLATARFIRGKDPRFDAAEVLATATPDDVFGAVVAGNLPLHLAALCVEVVAVEFTTPPRGAEYTPQQMLEAGARLVSYVVARKWN